MCGTIGLTVGLAVVAIGGHGCGHDVGKCAG